MRLLEWYLTLVARFLCCREYIYKCYCCRQTGSYIALVLLLSLPITPTPTLLLWCSNEPRSRRGASTTGEHLLSLTTDHTPSPHLTTYPPPFTIHARLARPSTPLLPLVLRSARSLAHLQQHIAPPTRCFARASSPLRPILRHPPPPVVIITLTLRPEPIGPTTTSYLNQ